MNREIIIVAGPTAVGKTKYAIEIAKAFNGEIVSSDSMQLYQFMDIGSAKPTPEEQAQVKHYLVNEIDPREPFSVAAYQKRAKNAMEHIFLSGKTPVVSGGTGLYVNSLIYDMDFSAPPSGSDYRIKLEELASEQGREYIHKLLQEKDPEAAARIHPNNLKKVIRALEVAENSETGIKPFEQSFVKTTDYSYTLIGLSRDREELYERINQRVDMLLHMGLVEEIKNLLHMGLTIDNISMKGIGYKEIIGYLNGEYDLEQAVYLVKRNTRHYAKRQMTWFKRYEDIKWFNLSEYGNDDEAVKEIISWLKKNR
ncbi:tRNA (adenosine(37)-N6)-dimethylallyltransferase MiaA [Aminipila luticellarii]|uniref:tRNA dimethylallyltransferase n=1 Tax=Aminipila luticellarii TaxID=2507160 RepID=A0A410PV73_9FIRM|nr:tRNA (adenosine(37)-N6)-dimethylallyltransferase MiaA [Aminipila luticellarii]QAT42851.1 tRNA (adenosine(37)-N6)-dimethylallyltransferase MiaA [Aminipila luticellarii]